jgi:hypothetical protein
VASFPLFGSGGLRVLDLPVHDPQVLVRVGPHDLEAGHPAGMLGHRMSLQVLRPKDPMAAALDRAGPLQPRLPRIVVGEQLSWVGAVGGLAAGAHEHRE